MNNEIYCVLGSPQAAMRPQHAIPSKRDGKLATVYLSGLITRGGEFGSSSDSLAREINALASDSSVAAIALLITSPGGKVAGTAELANAVANAAKQKYVGAYIQDVGASGAYWVASGATKIFADQLGIVGSIGTYNVVVDTSGLANQIGVKTHVVRAGKYKGAGVPGAPVTDEQLADVQRVVDSINEHFIAGVASGRKMSLDRVRQLADGRVHVGQEAVALGLVDGVLSYDSFRSQLQAEFSTTQMKGSGMFSEEKSAGEESREFWQRVEDKITEGRSRGKAIEAVVMANPELHQAMLAESNR